MNDFLYVAATCRYPSITTNEISWFAKHANIFDKTRQTLKATNVELETRTDVSGNSLTRFQWVELLVRIGNEKYKRVKAAKTVAEGL